MTEQEIAEQETARFVFDQISWIASKWRRSNAKACDFHHLTLDEKIEYTNKVVLPLWEDAGSPKEGSRDCLNFVRGFFA